MCRYLCRHLNWEGCRQAAIAEHSDMFAMEYGNGFEAPGVASCGHMESIQHGNYHDTGVVRDSNSGHQLLLPPANWCPIFASRTTHRSQRQRAGSGFRLHDRGRHGRARPRRPVSVSTAVAPAPFLELSQWKPAKSAVIFAGGASRPTPRPRSPTACWRAPGQSWWPAPRPSRSAPRRARSRPHSAWPPAARSGLWWAATSAMVARLRSWTPGPTARSGSRRLGRTAGRRRWTKGSACSCSKGARTTNKAALPRAGT